MINGVVITPREQIKDERGMVSHMLRNDEPIFSRFGEIYFSYVNPRVVKGWHQHTEMTLNYAVVSGKIRLALYDDRDDSKTKGELMEIVSGVDENYVLITIPPLVWNGFVGLGDQVSTVANCATIPYDPDEIKRIDPWKNNLITYDWLHGEQ